MEINTLIVCTIILSFFILSPTSHFTNLLILLLLSIICVFIEYDTFFKKQNINHYNKVLYLILDYIHVFIFLCVMYLISITIKSNCNLNYLFLLNIFVLITLLLFFYFKGCVITLIMYKIIDIKNWVNPIDRIKYILGIDKNYNMKYKKNRNTVNDWINGQYLFVSVVLILNIYCFFKMKKC